MVGSRMVEALGALSLATDSSVGFPPETALRTALCAGRVARALGADERAVRASFDAGLLRFLGCTAVAHEAAGLAGGDDIGFLALYGDVDFGDPMAVVGRTVRRLAADQPLVKRARSVARFLSDPKGGDKVAEAHCTLARELARQVGMPPDVLEVLGHMYERWDGRGPQRVRGDALSLATRVVHAAHVCEVFARGGPARAASELARRSGGHFDPAVVRVVVREVVAITRGLDQPSVWDDFLAEEPAPWRELTDRTEIARAFATFVDVKSPFTLTHSPRVAELATAALEELGGSAAACADLEAAALLHDLGRAGVPNGIWDKPGELNAVEWTRVREYVQATERVLTQSPLLAPLAELACSDHERCDGSGYPRRVPRSMLSLEARVLGAADVYAALQEERAHRRALSRQRAASVLTEEARAGRLCPTAVEAVLAADGQRRRAPRAHPNELTDREVDVLCLVARGLTNKEVADRLKISPRTVQTHLAHVFDKTGTRTRAGVAMFAAAHGLGVQ